MKINYSISSLRAIAIIQVLLIHVFSYYFHSATSTIFLIPFFDQIIQSAVPIFIFISGYTLSLRYWENFSIKTFYKKRFKNIIFPYAFFSTLYIVIPSLIDGTPIIFDFEDFLNILFDPWNFYYVFWYIALISSFYIFYPLLLKIFLCYKNQLFLVLMASILIQIVYRYFHFFIIISLESLSNFIVLYKFLYWILNYSFLRFISYFVLGVYICKNYSKLDSNRKFIYLLTIPVFIFATLGAIINSYIFEPFFSIFIILIYLVFLLNKQNFFLETTAKYSFGMYLIHALIMDYVVRLLDLSFNYWYFYLFSFVLTFTFSISIIFGLSKVPKSHYLIGKTEINY
ncbi:MAG: acyltransferase [Promethearchaeota archaeon]